MFNTYRGGNNSVHINAVSGAIVKNHAKSWFRRFHLNSDLADKYLTTGGHEVSRYRGDKEKDAVIILQMIICGDMEVIAECVYKGDFEADFEREADHD